MIAAVGGIDLRRAAEFAADEHERGGEHAALVEIADEAGEGLVKRHGLALKAAFDVRVVIPAAVGDADHAHAGLDETAGEQEALPGGVAAVFVAQFVGLGFQIEGLARLRAADEVVGTLIKAVHGANRVRFLRGAEMIVHGLQQVAAAVEALVIDVLRRGEIAHGEVSIRRIAAEREGTEGAAHVAAALLRRDDAGDDDVGRQVVPAALLMADDGAEAGKLDRRAGSVAGEHVVSAALVRRLAMRDGADHRDLVEDLGDVREALADILAGDAFDRCKRATIFRRGEGFRVPGLMLRHAAGQVDVNDGGGDGLEGFHRGHFELLRGLQLQELRQSDAEAGQRADLQKFATLLGAHEGIRVFAGAERMHFHDEEGSGGGNSGRTYALLRALLPGGVNPPILAHGLAIHARPPRLWRPGFVLSAARQAAARPI